jgi:DNA helicase-2/ATP-dependent DNA helicase PcrA
MKFLNRYSKLNKEQKEAVDSINGPVMVIAGPGSGKTELLSLRVVNILKKSDVEPVNILCLTFTDGAAKNMQERLGSLIGPNAYEVATHTFHSFSLYVAQLFKTDFYENGQLQPADDIAQIDILGSIIQDFPLSNPYSKKGYDKSFLYLKSIKNKIQNLKKSGISPEEFLKIINTNAKYFSKIEEILIPIFEQRISKKILAQIPEALEKINNLEQVILPVQHISLVDYKKLLLHSLSNIYEKSLEDNSTRPLTKWKDEWFAKDAETKKLHLKDAHQLERNISLADVYKKYQKELLNAGLMDFDDMILNVLKVMQEKPGVLEQIQEKFEYILVDEFQDTNEAQMRILEFLTDNPVHENNPNIMVVGDDDQAVFKFQGAEINNVLQFKNKFPSTKIITLTKNYRSTGEIVNFAQEVISQSEERLVNKIDEVVKELKAGNPNIIQGNIVAHTFDTSLHEYSYIAKEIKNRQSKGEKLSSMAVITRKHKDLQNLVDFLHAENISIQYEKRRNVLDDPHIIELIQTARLISSVAENNIYYQNELMPEVLLYPFWGIDRKVIWQLSIEASNKRKDVIRGRWIDVMLSSENEKLNKIANWVLYLASKCKTESLGNILDAIVGNSSDNEFTSPFRQYYFHKEKYEQNPLYYLEFLSSLNTFINTIRSFSSKIEAPRIADLIKCVDAYNEYGLPIIDTSPFLSGQESVTLLTAHKAKGLEFDTVFVMNCQNDVWAKSANRDLIAFPRNLPIDPAGETIDDYIRLFFVAITRAKSNLYLTAYLKKENGKDSLVAPFVSQSTFKNYTEEVGVEYTIKHTIELLEQNVFESKAPLAIDEKVLLKPQLDKYILSVTHLNNFLNVSKGGPYNFFEQNFLRFPQAKTPPSSYGTAVHSTMERIYIHLKQKTNAPSLQEAQEYFKEELLKEKMAEADFKKYLDKGKEMLKVYFQSAFDRFNKNDRIETDFKNQNVFVDGVHITGKIDKMLQKEKELEVYDFKTGAYQLNWAENDPAKKISNYNYKRQLIFYKLLVESSRDFSKYKVKKGYLEFLNPTKSEEIFCLSYDITDKDVEYLKKLIVAVNKKIQTLDFPDVSIYEPTLNGILKFEEDLINGKV